jgi:hypothetical protein
MTAYEASPINRRYQGEVKDHAVMQWKFGNFVNIRSPHKKLPLCTLGGVGTLSILGAATEPKKPRRSKAQFVADAVPATAAAVCMSAAICLGRMLSTIPANPPGRLCAPDRVYHLITALVPAVGEHSGNQQTSALSELSDDFPSRPGLYGGRRRDRAPSPRADSRAHRLPGTRR